MTDVVLSPVTIETEVVVQSQTVTFDLVPNIKAIEMGVVLGPPGPPGQASGTTLSGMYEWNAEEGNPGSGEITGLDVGSDASRGEGPVTGHLNINQIDANGFDNSYFEVQIGNTLLVRNNAGGSHKLLVIGREIHDDYAILEYSVVESTATPLLGSLVAIALLPAPLFITISSMAPSDPAVNDVWIDTT